MKKLILASALGTAALLVSACGDRDAETDDTAVVDETATAQPTADAAGGTSTTTTASADWPARTRIVEEGGVTYRVNPDGARVVIDDNSWRVVTEGGTRYRVGPDGTRVRIDDEGFDIDVGINERGNLDVDVGAEDRPGE